MITNDGRCTTEISHRIGRAKAAFYENERLLTSNANIDMKKQFIKTVVWSNALYAAETWTLTKQHQNQLEAFEMWCWRHMLEIKWQQKTACHNLRTAESVDWPYLERGQLTQAGH